MITTKPVTYSLVEIDARSTRVLLTGMAASEANRIAARLAKLDESGARFMAREDK